MPAGSIRATARDRLQDRADIIDTICLVTMRLDCGEIDRILDLFTDDAVMRYGQAFGDDKVELPAAEFMKFSQTFITGFDSTQHQVTNFDIALAGDSASCRSQVYARHAIGERIWTVAGTYSHELRRLPVGWRISMMGVRVLFNGGPREELLSEARTRVAQNSGARTQG
jgi:hypothetical protein